MTLAWLAEVEGAVDDDDDDANDDDDDEYPRTPGDDSAERASGTRQQQHQQQQQPAPHPSVTLMDGAEPLLGMAPVARSRRVWC